MSKCRQAKEAMRFPFIYVKQNVKICTHLIFNMSKYALLPFKMVEKN